MSGAPYLAWLLTREDTLRLSPPKECFGGLGQTQLLATAQAEVAQPSPLTPAPSSRALSSPL